MRRDWGRLRRDLLGLVLLILTPCKLKIRMPIFCCTQMKVCKIDSQHSIRFCILGIVKFTQRENGKSFEEIRWDSTRFEEFGKRFARLGFGALTTCEINFRFRIVPVTMKTCSCKPDLGLVFDLGIVMLRQLENARKNRSRRDWEEIKKRLGREAWFCSA